jgi:hypothetical protein
MPAARRQTRLAKCHFGVPLTCRLGVTRIKQGIFSGVWFGRVDGRHDRAVTAPKEHAVCSGVINHEQRASCQSFALEVMLSAPQLMPAPVAALSTGVF